MIIGRLHLLNLSINIYTMFNINKYYIDDIICIVKHKLYIIWNIYILKVPILHHLYNIYKYLTF